MSRLRYQVANRLWALACQPEAAAFQRGLAAVAVTQERLLRQMLVANRNTAFGREHDFARIASARDYRQAVPLRDYADFAPAIERIRRGERNVLTAEPVLLLEPTGGSSGGSKLIPYTAGLKRQFLRGIAPWIVDLYRRHPGLYDGAAYWSATPAASRADAVDSTVPVGFEDDSDYAGTLGKWLVRSVQVVPDVLKTIGDIESFWYLTLLFLLRNRDLALISIWNSTFLTILDRHRQSWWPQLADDIASGSFSLPSPLPIELQQCLLRNNRPDPARGEEIRRACALPVAETYCALWPKLRLISCWRDAAAAAPAAELHNLFPNVTIQGKGLLATEGFMTLPLHGVDGCLPAYRSHFFEFVPEGGGEVRLLHELEAGQTYSLVVTTAGGLYRYRMHDLVRVVGFQRSAPLLRFIGKEDHIADRFGEKLHETHVSAVLRQSTAEIGIRPNFYMLACEEVPQPAYVFFVEAPAATDELLRKVGGRIDTLLMENFHYGYGRRLGQIAPVRVFRIDRNGEESYLRHCMQNGQRPGTIKPLALSRGSGWISVFTGSLLDAVPQPRKEMP